MGELLGIQSKKSVGEYIRHFLNVVSFSAYTRAIFDCVVRKPTIF